MAKRRYTISERFKFGFGGFRFRRVRTAASPGALTPFLAVLQPIYTITSTSVADVILSTTSVGGLVYTNTTGAVNVRGFVGGAIPGQLFGFYNAGSFAVTIKHMDGTIPDGSARVKCPGSVDLVLAAGESAYLWFNDQLNYWLVFSVTSLTMAGTIHISGGGLLLDNSQYIQSKLLAGTVINLLGLNTNDDLIFQGMNSVQYYGVPVTVLRISGAGDTRLTLAQNNGSSHGAIFNLADGGDITIRGDSSTILLTIPQASGDIATTYGLNVATGVRIAMGTTARGAKLHVGGGDASTTFAAATIALGYDTAGQYAHYIHTRHNGGGTSNNAIDFYTGDGTAAGVYPTNAVLGLTVNGGKVGVNDSAPSYRFSVGEANGQELGIDGLTELTTIAAAATTDTAIQIPAGAIVLAVSVRCTTTIPTAATFTVTGATSGTAFNTAAVSTTAPATDPGTKAGAFYNATAQAIRITPNINPATNAGRVRVTIHYIKCTPATS